MGKGKGKFTHTHIQNPEKNWVQVYDFEQEEPLYPFLQTQEPSKEHIPPLKHKSVLILLQSNFFNKREMF